MSIKIFHTSDWHLGKKLYKTSRIPEQKIFLHWLLDRIQREDIDLLIIAGDIFDSPIPPTEALTLYFSFLDQLIKETKCNAYIIAGNHDSGRFLEAPKAILPSDRIHIVGDISSKLSCRYEKEGAGGIDLVLLPYFRSYEMLNLTKEVCEDDEQKIIQTLNRLLSEALPKEKKYPQLLVAHHVFGKFISEGSEQSLSLSGLDSLPLDQVGKDFDYLALGHIHKPQEISSHVIYSGSPIPFRFSETQAKHLYKLEVSGGTIQYAKIKVPQSRIMKSLSCNETNFLKKIQDFKKDVPHEGVSALLEIKIKLDRPQNTIIDHIRDLMNNCNIELLAIHTILPTPDEEKTHTVRIDNELDLLSQFKNYYQIKSGSQDNVPAPLLDLFQELLDEITMRDKS